LEICHIEKCIDKSSDEGEQGEEIQRAGVVGYGVQRWETVYI